MNESTAVSSNFVEPPQKVLLMYQAVIDLIKEKRDINAIKVADITGKAGIGKGTAYEYFHSKEEIITRALIYEYRCKMLNLEEMVKEYAGFKDKFYCILSWLKENSDYHTMFFNLIQISTGSADICNAIRTQLPAFEFEAIHQYFYHTMNELMDTAYQQGLIVETNSDKRRIAFVSAIFSYITTIVEPASQRFFKLDNSEAMEFSYESLIRTLSSKK